MISVISILALAAIAGALMFIIWDTVREQGRHSADTGLPDDPFWIMSIGLIFLTMIVMAIGAIATGGM